MLLHVKKAGDDFQCEAIAGETLLNALRRAGMAPASCCGNRRCGHCKVKLSRSGGSWIYVLACAVAVESNMAVIVPEESAETTVELGCLGSISGHIGVAAAVDIGTSTIAAALLVDGVVTAVAGARNPQTGFGESVIDRIAAASDPNIHAEMRRSVSLAISGLLCQLSPDPTRIERVAIVGNPVMSLLFAGYDIASLGHAPFEPECKNFPELPAEKLGLDVIGQGKPVTTAPLFSGFIGGDLTAGAEAIQLGRTDQPELMVDLGTNCELLLSAGGRIYAASAAAGPAFENAASTEGRLAAAGVIDHVFWRDEADDPGYSVIGKASPCGICGSGLIDLLAVLKKHGRIDQFGRLNRDLYPEGVCQIAPGVTIDNAAIAELLSAKAAVAAGIGALLARGGVTANQLSRVILCGGFATGLNLDSAQAIGLLPHGKAFERPGNSALAGALLLAAAPKSGNAVAARFANAEEVLLNDTPDFETRFADALLLNSAEQPPQAASGQGLCPCGE